MILFSSELELGNRNNCKMSKLIIDTTKDKIFFMIINNHINYNITHENTKINLEKLIILINDFLNLKKIRINGISEIYVNRGPGSFAAIRNTLSTIKALHLVKKIDYYCYSFKDFKGVHKIEYENIPDLCNKFNVKKNLINPLY